MVSLPAGGWRVFDQLKLRGGKANWAYTLNEPSQGRIAVRLQLGSATAWCADAPARPSDSGKNDHVDKFTAQPKTPPPASCPAAP